MIFLAICYHLVKNKCLALKFERFPISSYTELKTVYEVSKNILKKAMTNQPSQLPSVGLSVLSIHLSICLVCLSCLSCLCMSVCLVSLSVLSVLPERIIQGLYSKQTDTLAGTDFSMQYLKCHISV